MEFKRFLGIHIHSVMEDFETFQTIQWPCRSPQHFKVVKNTCLNTLQPGFCCPQALRFNPKGDILCLHQTIIPFCELHFQHIRIFLPDVIKRIPFWRNVNGLGILIKVDLLV